MARRSSAVELSNDAVILIEQWGTGGTAFGNAILPFVDPPNSSTCGIVVVGRIFVDADFLQITRWVVNARGILNRGRVCSIPARIEDVVASRRGFIQQQERKIRSAAVFEDFGAANRLVGGAVVARAPLGFVVEHKRPIPHAASEAVVGGEEQR